jgi:hypothetical protein
LQFLEAKLPQRKKKNEKLLRWQFLKTRNHFITKFICSKKNLVIKNVF